MDLALEILVFTINVGLVAASLWLARVVAGSVFAKIPLYLIVMAAALAVHSGIDLFLSGPNEAFLYAVAALLASVSYLAVVYGIYVVLKTISDGPARS